MRLFSLATLAAFIVTTSASLFAEIPKMQRGNRYGAGRTVAESRSTKHVQGREYHNSLTGHSHRRILIYDKKTGELKSFSKLGRRKGDATSRHYFNK